MTTEHDENGEASVRPSTGLGVSARGEVDGVPWAVTVEGTQVQLTIGGRRVHVVPDGIGSFVTHEMVGRWRDLGELARMMIKYHPGYSPRARRN